MVQLIASGLAMGCVYGLVGLSFILVYNATGALNFAQGELVMLGAFLAAWLVGIQGIPYLGMVALTLLMMVGVGYLYQRIGYYPLRDKPFLAFVIATIGLSIFLRNLALIIWGPDPKKMPSFFQTQVIAVAGAALTPENLFIIAVTIGVLTLQYLLFFHTRLGRKLRATAQNQEVARLMGISVGRTIALTFVMSTLLAGLAGILVAPIFLVDVDMGINLIFKAFIAVVIGGFGSVPGAVVGGLIIGLLEIFLAVYVSSVYKDALAFATLIVFLFIFPRGIFGEAVAEKV